MDIETSLAMDLTLAQGSLAQDDGLRTAIFLSLFTDAPSADYAGWWGNGIESGDVMGSTLWTLQRVGRSNELLRQAEDAAMLALRWLVEDGRVKQIDVVASWVEVALVLNIRVDNIRMRVEV